MRQHDGTPTAAVGAHRQSWDVMMEHYLPGRAELVAAGCEEVEQTLGRAPASALDLGGGPGTTVEAMLRRWPHMRAGLCDLDPVMLALARAALPQTVSVDAVDLSSPGWTTGVRDRYDLVLAVMTLHYFPAVRVRELYREIGDVLTPHGTLIVVEPMPDPATRREQQSSAEPWRRWWHDLSADPVMRPLLADREHVLAGMEPAEFVAAAQWHRDAARVAGFLQSRVVLRLGDHTVLAATRARS